MPPIRPLSSYVVTAPPFIDVVSILSRNDSTTTPPIKTTREFRPEDELDFYDEFVLFDLRLWMVIAGISTLITTMIVIVCCIVRFRIPRSRREIEIIAARRRMRTRKSQKRKEKAANEERAPAIVMNNAVQRLPSMKRAASNRSTTKSITKKKKKRSNA